MSTIKVLSPPTIILLDPGCLLKLDRFIRIQIPGIKSQINKNRGFVKTIDMDATQRGL
jgi:hypothetical protein